MKIRFNLITTMLIMGFLSTYVFAAETDECGGFRGAAVRTESLGKTKINIIKDLWVPIDTQMIEGTKNTTEIPMGFFKAKILKTHADFYVNLPKLTQKEWENVNKSDSTVISASRELECRCYIKQAETDLNASRILLSNIETCSQT